MLSIYDFLIWHFRDYPKELLRIWKNFLDFGFFFFSTRDILKTFFSPWKRIYFEKPRGFQPFAYFEIFVGNLSARIIGIVVRSFVLFLFLLFEIFIFFFGLLMIFLLVLYLPLLFIYGAKKLFPI